MRFQALALALFMLCVFSNIANSSVPPFSECSPGSLTPIPATNGGVGLALLALTISFDVIAIGYMANKLFPSAGIANWLQGEYWEVAKSAIIIVCIYSAIAFMGNMAYLLVPSAVSAGGSSGGFADITPLVNGAEGYLCTVNTNLINSWEWMGVISGGTGFWSSFQEGFYVPITIPPYLSLFDGVAFQPFQNYMLQTGNYIVTPFGSVVNDSVNFLLFPFTAVVVGLIVLLPSLAYIGITFFVPLGLIFRALPFIRGIGGTLIAIGIALCLVLPGVFVIYNYQVTQLVSSSVAITSSPPSLLGESCSSSLQAGGILQSLICLASPVAGSATSSVGNLEQSIWYTTPVFGDNAIFFFMNTIMQSTLFIIFQMFLLASDLMLMYPLVDNIAKAMGGTIRIRLGGRLRIAS